MNTFSDMKMLSEIYARRELLYNLVSRNLTSRYKNSMLGFLWSILTPLFMAVIYVVFLRILARAIRLEEVLIGVFAWQFTAQCVGNGLTCVTDNANLVKKVYFPRMILPLSMTLSNLVNFLLSLIVQFVLVAILLARHGQYIPASALAVPALVAYHAMFCFSIALFLSCVNVYFRDLQHLVNVLLLAWFFLSPAMYTIELVNSMAAELGRPMLASMYMLNPMAAVITGYRAMILPGTSFPWSWFAAASIIWPAAFLAGSYALFQKLQRNFSDML